MIKTVSRLDCVCDRTSHGTQPHRRIHSTQAHASRVRHRTSHVLAHFAEAYLPPKELGLSTYPCQKEPLLKVGEDAHMKRAHSVAES